MAPNFENTAFKPKSRYIEQYKAAGGNADATGRQRQQQQHDYGFLARCRCTPVACTDRKPDRLKSEALSRIFANKR